MTIRSIVLSIAFLVPLAASAQAPKRVEVINDPLAVEVTNLPAVQDVNVVAGATGGCEVKRFQLVGFTGTPVSPDQGFLGFTRICQAEFPGSRFCNTAEIIASINVPAIDAGPAWVNPSMSMPLPNAFFLDPSGIEGISGAGAGMGLVGLTCPGRGSYEASGSWRSTEPLSRGVVVDADGKFGKNSCSELHPVACCALVP